VGTCLKQLKQEGVACGTGPVCDGRVRRASLSQLTSTAGSAHACGADERRAAESRRRLRYCGGLVKHSLRPWATR
jgi:histidine ammonia-lyase